MEAIDAFNSLRSEMAAGFSSTATRIGALENELHRHQDDDRADMGSMRSDIRLLTTNQDLLTGRIQGSLAMIKWVLGIPAFIAAAGTMIGLIRHW